MQHHIVWQFINQVHVKGFVNVNEKAAWEIIYLHDIYFYLFPVNDRSVLYLVWIKEKLYEEDLSSKIKM